MLDLFLLEQSLIFKIKKLRAGFFIMAQWSINIHAQKAPIIVFYHGYNFHKYFTNKSFFHDLQFLSLLFL